MKPKEMTKIAVFKGQQVRKIFISGEWWFSIIDVVAVLTDSDNPRDYWYKMKIREKNEARIELSTICRQLKLTAPDGKKRKTDCAKTEGVFRIIQSIPSRKAEPFKHWLARVGKERLDEIENPELGMQGAFNLKVEDYKRHKAIKRQNLRDHMTDLELIITMLGEAATTRITQDRDSQGVPQLQKDAKDGGAVAGRTRKDLEQQTGTKVISKRKLFTQTTSKDHSLNQMNIKIKERKSV